MLEIFINEKSVTLDPKSKLSLKIKNPLLNDQGTFSYPLSAPLEPNRVVFEHVEQIDNPGMPALSFSMRVEGEEFMTGNIGVTDTVESFEFYVKSGKSAAAYKLRNTYLNQDANGIKWGDNPDGMTAIKASLNKTYPEVPFTIAPVKIDDDVANQIDPDTGELYEKKSFFFDEKWYDASYMIVSMQAKKHYFYDEDYYLYRTSPVMPMVFVRHLLRQIANGLGLVIKRDDLLQNPDFNRLAVFCPTFTTETFVYEGNEVVMESKIIKKDYFTKLANFMPAITAADFINDLRDRFNICFYINELENSVEIILGDNAMTMPPADLSHKFIADTEKEVLAATQITYANSGDDDLALSDIVVEKKYSIVQVPTFNDIYKNLRVVQNIYASASYVNQSHFYVSDVKKYYQATPLSFESDVRKGYYIAKETVEWGGITAFSVNEKNFTDRSESSWFFEQAANGTPGVYTHLCQFLMPEVQGDLIDNVTIKDLCFKTDTTEPVTVRVMAFILTKSGATTPIGEESFEVINTKYGVNGDGEYEELTIGNAPVLHDVYIPIPQSTTIVTDPANDPDVATDKRVLVQISFYHPTAARPLTMRFWNHYVVQYTSFNQTQFETQIHFDYNRPLIAELNPLKPFTNNVTSENNETITPKGDIPTMCKARMSGYLFQMAQSNIEPKSGQNEYNYMIVRPPVTDEVLHQKAIPFAAIDVTDTDGQDYTARLTEPYTPQLSLLWHGNKGLVNQLHRTSVLWKTHTKRQVRKKMKLTISDIINTRLYQPIVINNEKYIINGIDVEISALGEIGEALVEMFTI